MKSKRMSIRLDPYTERLIARAVRVTRMEYDPRWPNWVAQWAVLAVFREIIRTGKFDTPMSVEFTPESAEDYEARCGKAHVKAARKWFMKHMAERIIAKRFKWNPGDMDDGGLERSAQ